MLSAERGHGATAFSATNWGPAVRRVESSQPVETQRVRSRTCPTSWTGVSPARSRVIAGGCRGAARAVRTPARNGAWPARRHSLTSRALARFGRGTNADRSMDEPGAERTRHRQSAFQRAAVTPATLRDGPAAPSMPEAQGRAPCTNWRCSAGRSLRQLTPCRTAIPQLRRAPSNRLSPLARRLDVRR